MTTVSAITNAVAAATQSDAAVRSGNATLTSDFETFLKMLTAQAEYQDPLDPISSSDYAAQLAQFSMVEQQVLTNERLSALTNALGGPDINTLASWIGMEARTTASVQFDGQPIALSTSPVADADQAELVVYNDFGSEVARLPIPLTGEDVTWDGRTASGDVAGAGTYRFSVESFADQALIADTPAEAFGRIVEAQIVDGDTILTFAGGGSVAASQITVLRASSD